MFTRREYGNSDNDPGELHDWRPEGMPAEAPPIRLRIRGIPASQENKIVSVHRADQLTVRHHIRQEMSETDINMERQRKIARDRAAFALLDSEPEVEGVSSAYTREPADEDSARFYSRVLSEVLPKGQAIDMHGRWGNGELKGHVLTEDPELTTYIVETVDRVRERRQREREAAQGN